VDFNAGLDLYHARFAFGDLNIGEICGCPPSFLALFAEWAGNWEILPGILTRFRLAAVRAMPAARAAAAPVLQVVRGGKHHQRALEVVVFGIEFPGLCGGRLKAHASILS
jgi:hypothetical protein